MKFKNEKKNLKYQVGNLSVASMFYFFDMYKKT